MTTILVGVDGSEGALNALRWASKLAAPLDVRLVITTAWTPSEVEMPAAAADAERTALRERLESEWSQPAREAGVDFECEVLDGNPADALLGAADRRDALLTVVGTRGTGGFAGLRLGSVADYVAHRTTRPLAVVPSGAWDDHQIRRMVLGLEGSDDDLWCVGFCGLLAGALHAEVVAVHAFRPPFEWLPETDPASWHTEVLRRLETEWTAPLAADGIRVTGRVETTNHAAEALVAVAGEEDADLIVVGTRALGGWRPLRLGGVTMQLLHHSTRPVIVVPPPS